MLFNKIKKKIIIGSWSWSGMYKTSDYKNVERIINYCIQEGFNEFDTSPTYKKAETILAKLKKKNNQILINTKCGWNPEMKKSFDIDDLINDLNKSLDKFHRINVIQLHNPRNEIKNWDEIIDIFNQYKKKKLINFYGISLARNFYFPIKVLNKFDFIQDEFNLLRLDPLKKMINYKKVLAARSIFANGILTESFNKKTKFLKNDHRYSWLHGERKKNILLQKEYLQNLTDDNVYKFALDFAFNFNLFDKYIIGIRTFSHLYKFLENLRNIKIIKKNVINEVINLHKNNKFFLSKYRYNN
jgi:aryl-alcohol dehydrogenase-like predicted oxidoreductase